MQTFYHSLVTVGNDSDTNQMRILHVVNCPISIQIMLVNNCVFNYTTLKRNKIIVIEQEIAILVYY